jgi:hypothetical protein
VHNIRCLEYYRRRERPRRTSTTHTYCAAFATTQQHDVFTDSITSTTYIYCAAFATTEQHGFFTYSSTSAEKTQHCNEREGWPTEDKGKYTQ